MKPITVRVGELVRARRLELGMSQLELAVAAGLSVQAQVQKIEHGQRCTLENLEAIAGVLGIELRELIP